MTVFWIIAAALSLGVAGVLAAALLAARRVDSPAASFDLKVYRDQLKEIDRDTARGVIGEGEAERLRTEISRRILAADTALRETRAATRRAPMAKALAVLMAVVVIAGAGTLYWQIGAPGYGDMALQDRIARAAEARATRPSQADAEAQVPAAAAPDASPEYVELVEKLRATTAERPDDVQGQRLLARSEAALGNYAPAYAAQQRLIDLLGEAATVRDHADLADMMILAAGGYVSPEAEAVLEEVMRRDPKNGVARYYGGLMMAQTGRPDAAFQMWSQLLRDSAPDAPWVPPIRAQIEEAARLAGNTNFQLPEAPSDGLRGPSAEDMEAAQDMSVEERMEMIEGMVAQLSDRLASDGGPPAEWARLITALEVLGRTDEARAILANAQEVFAGNDAALAPIMAAARQAGLTP